MFAECARTLFRLPKRRGLRRAIHVISAIFVFSFVSFQVLDPDLSDFASDQSSGDTILITAETPETTELANAISQDSLRIVSSLSQLPLTESIRLRQKHLRRYTTSRATQIHLHRLKIPRSSVSDSSAA